MTDERIITFDPALWGLVREGIRTSSQTLPTVGVRFSALVASSIGHHELADGTQVFPDMGWGVVDAANLDPAKLAAIPGVIVRPARVFRRPRTILTPTFDPLPKRHISFRNKSMFGDVLNILPVASGPGGMWFDDAALTWVLKSIGVTSTDCEGGGILVGVIDTGVDRTHPDLSVCIADALPSPYVPTWNGAADVIGHGTHVCGVIAGAVTPVKGPRYGIAPKARIVSYRIYKDHEETSEPIVVAAIRAAVDRGCRVIALASGVEVGDDFTASDAQLGDYVTSRGSLLFAAGGNESERKKQHIAPTDAPANAPRIDAVGATDRDDTLWDSSNGSATDDARRIDWLGCGVDVRSALANTLNKTGKTIAASGTSAATAVVAGIAAAVWSRNPSWSASKLRETLTQLTTAVAGPAGAIGNGRLRIR